jgi:adenine-specific DNA-methyltransferase
MINQELKHIINRFKEDEASLNAILVTIFVRSSAIPVVHNKLINSLLITPRSALFTVIAKSALSLNFDELIESFELAIPISDKIINGAVYTPNSIKSFIVEQTINKTTKPLEHILVSDIACGCGAFLFTLAQTLRLKTNKSFAKIFQDNLFGLDISEISVLRTKILLSLLALSAGEDLPDFVFHIHTGNALDFDWRNAEVAVGSNQGFDLIIGNPPYVRAKNIDALSRRLLGNYLVTKSGNPDLYIPFFEIGLQQLNRHGILGYITVNSFYKSVNARELRRFLHEKKYEIQIIDFGHERIFYGISAYTCICLIRKTASDVIAFSKSSRASLQHSNGPSFHYIPYRDLDDHNGWLINDRNVVENIKKIEAAGVSLGDKYKIKNGIATLSNDTYIFKPIAEIGQYYILEDAGQRYQIERELCKDIIKPNILKHEHEIDEVKEKLIFPYQKSATSLALIKEKSLKQDFPKAYQYLLSKKQQLAKRDKGNGDYDAWYAFGRTQALADKGLKLLFPYMAKKPHFVFTDNAEMLIYCGYAVFDESEQELKMLKRILESKVFEYYMANTSKPYSGGYFSYAKNYVKNFGICPLTEDEKYFLSNGVTKKEVNEFLINKYQLSL